jgi:8-oxo-dGTP pyrophosphatase MutT (NUDIX family)
MSNPDPQSDRTTKSVALRQVKSCGIIVFRSVPELSFLLMKHSHRFDLPKGHMEEGETEIQTALREMWEETGIPATDVKLDPEFRYEETYFPVEPRFGHERVEKKLVIFLGWIKGNPPIVVSEHAGYEWKRWHPPHEVQRYTINPLLEAILRHFETHPLPRD